MPVRTLRRLRARRPRDARLLIGNVALLIPPIAPILVMFSRRGHWS
jgi:hypothetical protein